MKKDLDHLPSAQQDELERVKQILSEEFSIATSRATQPWKKNGRIRNIILFGSYARNDWVDDAVTGYQSDYDILVTVSHKDLTDTSEYWYIAEDRIVRDTHIQRHVNIIVHTLDEVNQAICRGEYFWVDIAHDGITLYQLPGSTLALPKPLSDKDAYFLSSTHYRERSQSIDQWIDLADYSLSKVSVDVSWIRKAAFNLHQAAETAYICFLLVRSHYVPRSHNLKFLRSLAESKEPRLVESWPRASKLDRRRFEFAKRSYVDARYSESFDVSIEDLRAIRASVGHLRDTVIAVSAAKLEDLREKAHL